MALNLQKSELSNAESSGGGSSRIASIYQETQTQSIYRAPVVPTPSSTSLYSNRPSSNTVVSKVGESFQARDRYSTAKGISSDQFFGRDEEDTITAREKLSKFSSATAIGSDMLYNDGHEDDYGMDSYSNSNSYNSSSQNSGLSTLKDSVGDFFADIQKRLG